MEVICGPLGGGLQTGPEAACDRSGETWRALPRAGTCLLRSTSALPDAASPALAGPVHHPSRDPLRWADCQEPRGRPRGWMLVNVTRGVLAKSLSGPPSSVRRVVIEATFTV